MRREKVELQKRAEREKNCTRVERERKRETAEEIRGHENNEILERVFFTSDNQRKNAISLRDPNIFIPC